MARFIFISLVNNIATIIAASLLLFLCVVATDGSELSLVIGVFLSSPILISISNKKKNTIKFYVSNLFSVKSIKYFVVISIAAIAVTLFVFFTNSYITVGMLSKVVIISASIICYLFASPILFRIATGEAGAFPGIKKSIMIACTLIAYVLAIQMLTPLSCYNEFFLVAASLMGCMLFVVVFCATTAIYSYKSDD